MSIVRKEVPSYMSQNEAHTREYRRENQYYCERLYLILHAESYYGYVGNIACYTIAVVDTQWTVILRWVSCQLSFSRAKIIGVINERRCLLFFYNVATFIVITFMTMFHFSLASITSVAFNSFIFHASDSWWDSCDLSTNI